MEFYGEFNGMCFLLCIVVQCTCTHHIHIYFDMMWCDVIMLKFNFISFSLFFCLYFFSSFIRIKRMNERYALSSNFFFRSFSVRLLARCCRFWWWCQICIVIEPLYLARSFALFLSRSRRLAMVLRQFRGGNLKMCRFDPIMRQSIDFVLFNGLRAKVNEWERASDWVWVCEKDNANEIDDIFFRRSSRTDRASQYGGVFRLALFYNSLSIFLFRFLCACLCVRIFLGPFHLLISFLAPYAHFAMN